MGIIEDDGHTYKPRYDISNSVCTCGSARMWCDRWSARRRRGPLTRLKAAFRAAYAAFVDELC